MISPISWTMFGWIPSVGSSSMSSRGSRTTSRPIASCCCWLPREVAAPALEHPPQHREELEHARRNGPAAVAPRAHPDHSHPAIAALRPLRSPCPLPYPLAADSPKGRRQGVLGPKLPPVGGTRGLRHRRLRRRDRRGAVAAAARARPRRARRRDLGRRALRGPRSPRARERALSFDLNLSLVFVRRSVTSLAAKFLRGGIENTHPYRNSTLALNADPARSARTTSTERPPGPRPPVRPVARPHRLGPRSLDRWFWKDCAFR